MYTVNIRLRSDAELTIDAKTEDEARDLAESASCTIDFWLPNNAIKESLVSIVEIASISVENSDM